MEFVELNYPKLIDILKENAKLPRHLKETAKLVKIPLEDIEIPATENVEELGLTSMLTQRVLYCKKIGDFDSAKKACKRNIEIYKRIPENTRNTKGLVGAYATYATLVQDENPEEAIYYYELELKEIDSAKGKIEEVEKCVFIANAKADLGTLYRPLDLNKSIRLLKDSLTERESLEGLVDENDRMVQLAYTYEKLAYSLETVDLRESINYRKMAIDSFEAVEGHMEETERLAYVIEDSATVYNQSYKAGMENELHLQKGLNAGRKLTKLGPMNRFQKHSIKTYEYLLHRAVRTYPENKEIKEEHRSVKRLISELEGKLPYQAK